MKWESVLAWRVERQHLRRASHRRARRRLRHLRPARPGACRPRSSRCGRAWTTRRTSRTCCGSSARWSRRGRSAARCTCCRTDELPLYVGAQAGLKPRYEQKSWLKHFKLTREGRPGDHRGRPEGAARTARSPARSSRAQVHDGLSRGYGDLLKPVAFRGELIFAESQGQNVRFALPEPFEPLDTEEATKEIARRFLTRYGPATREDLAKWFGSPSPAVPRPLDQGARRRGGRDRVRLGARRRRRRDSRPRSRPASSTCCPRSTSTWSPRRATRGRRPRPSASTARAAGSRPCCSSTA